MFHFVSTKLSSFDNKKSNYKKDPFVRPLAIYHLNVFIYFDSHEELIFHLIRLMYIIFLFFHRLFMMLFMMI